MGMRIGQRDLEKRNVRENTVNYRTRRYTNLNAWTIDKRTSKWGKEKARQKSHAELLYYAWYDGRRVGIYF